MSQCMNMIYTHLKEELDPIKKIKRGGIRYGALDQAEW